MALHWEDQQHLRSGSYRIELPDGQLWLSREDDGTWMWGIAVYGEHLNDLTRYATREEAEQHAENWLQKQHPGIWDAYRKAL